MPLRKELLKNYRLYAIIDKAVCSERGIIRVAEELKVFSDLIVQFRDKHSLPADFLSDAQRLRPIFKDTGNLFIINDSVDAARITDSDGVHLGQSDATIESARKVLGRDKIIGISCSNLKEALDAQSRGADYIGVGPVFHTRTKDIDKAFGLDLLEEMKYRIEIPVFAIGGINEINLHKVLEYGVWGAAVCRDICHAENISHKVRELKRIIENS